MNSASVYIVLLVSLFLLTAPGALGQAYEAEDIDYQKLLDAYFAEELQENPDVLETLLANLQSHYDLNHITRDELTSIMVLSELQVNNFIQYRQRFGPFLTVYELLAIPGFDADDARRLLLFCSVGRTVFRARARHQLTLRTTRMMQEKEGFRKSDTLDSKFLGGRNGYFIRYGYRKGEKLEAGFTADHDAGEVFALTPRKGQYYFDFTSFFLQWKGSGILKKVILGDFRFQNGRGLVYGPAFSPGIGSEVRFGNAGSSALLPSRSAYEAKEFSGIGVTLGQNQFSANVLCSKTALGATLHNGEEDDNVYFKAFRTTGLHRSRNEQATRRTVSEFHVGVNPEYSSRNGKLNVGLNAAYTKFSHPMIADDVARNAHFSGGDENEISGGYVNVFLKNTHVFSEFALSRGGHHAAVAGITYQIHSDVAVSAIWRDFSPGFQSFKGNVLSQRSTIRNERGIYLGLKARLLKDLVFQGYLDSHYFPWIGYRHDRPSQGNEALFSLNYSKYRYFQLSLVHRRATAEQNARNSEEAFTPATKFRQQRTLISSHFFISDKITWKCRLQWSQTVRENERDQGFLLSSGVSYRRGGIKLSGFFTVFDTDDFENRQYIYLNSVPYMYRISALQGAGSNLNFLLNWQVKAKINLSYCYTQNLYDSVYETGSGLEKITGNKRSDMALQLTLSF